MSVDKDDKADRLTALIDNAELLIDYNAQTRVLPNSTLEEAIKPFLSDDRPDYNSDETRKLRSEITRMVGVIKPVTLNELRNFFPYTTSNRKMRLHRRQRFWRGAFRVAFTGFALYLIVLCATFTLWSNRASIFLGDVQTEVNRLASERLNDILNRWDVVPTMTEAELEKTKSLTPETAAEDFRIVYGYHQKFQELAGRQRRLVNNNPSFLAPTPGVAALIQRAHPMTPVGSYGGAPPVIVAKAPADTGATGGATGTTDGITGLSGDTADAGPSDTLAQAFSGQVPSVRSGVAQSYTSDTNCLDVLEPRLKDYAELVAEQEAARAVTGSDADASGTITALKASMESRVNELETRIGQSVRSAMVAVAARRINMETYGCLYNVSAGENTNFDFIRNYYLETLRDIRDRLDVRNSWILPGLYGAMGAVMLTLRIMVNPAIPSPAPFRTLIRVLLGAFVGVIIGWFWSPQSTEFFDVANISVGLFTMAFLFGYGIDIFFGILERLILAVSEVFDRQKTPT
ncbi:MAG: hypothetical protein CML66_31010 [Rhodobacteraceae bacterium]|nr:hypothetical protein [Paracoccaceae bacterium]